MTTLADSGICWSKLAAEPKKGESCQITVRFQVLERPSIAAIAIERSKPTFEVRAPDFVRAPTVSEWLRERRRSVAARAWMREAAPS